MQSDRLAISDYDVILTAVGGEYKAEQKFCQSFIVKYTNIQVLKTSWCLNSVIYCEVVYCS